jgi:hypothetical protein
MVLDWNEYLFREVDKDNNDLPSFTNWDDELKRWADTVNTNPVIKELDTFLKEEMHSTSITDEERDKLYARYLEMKLALFDKAVELAKTFTRPSKLPGDMMEPHFGLSIFEMQYKEGLQKVALLEKQTRGFDRDMDYKLIKTLSEQAAMLAQADQSTPDWMVDIMKILSESMTEGRINVIKNGSTSVEYGNDSGNLYDIGLDQ